MGKMKHFTALFTLAASLVGFSAQAYETADYTIVQQGKWQGKTVEIRAYAPTLLAEVVQPGETAQQNNAFMQLFRYIQGANTTQTDIAMTTPVQQQPTAEVLAKSEPADSAKIAMTTPVLQAPTAGNAAWKMAFHLPKKYTLATAPVPTNPNIRLREQPAQMHMAIAFSGRSSDGNFTKHAEKLRAYMAAKNIAFKEPAIHATYDGPFTPWFMRHNEVLFRLK